MRARTEDYGFSGTHYRRAGTYARSVTFTSTQSQENMMSDPTVVLVHGAFADASGFAGIVRELEKALAG